MKKLLFVLAAAAFAQFAGGCGLFYSKNYTGYEAYGQAHPEMVQPPSYMDPDRDYRTDR